MVSRFLLASLHLGALARKHSKRDVRSALRSLPEEINDTYQEAMDRICAQDSEDVHLAKRILSWITCARRPLTVQELQCALAIQPGTTALDEEALPDEDLFILVSGGLVTIDQESNIIRLVHPTAEEYLSDIRTKQCPSAELDIVIHCLTWLTFDVFTQGVCHSPMPTPYLDAICQCRRCLEQERFAYASQTWVAHLRGSLELDENVKPLVLRLLRNTVAMKNMIRALGKEDLVRRHQAYFKDCSLGLHFAAATNLLTTLDILLQSGAQIDTKNRVGFTALHWAAMAGHKTIVEYLTSQEAQINQKDMFGRAALHISAWNGHEGVTSLLCESGAMIEARDCSGFTPLLASAESQHRAVMVGLLKRGADTTAETVKSNTALHFAVKHGDESMLSLLLEHGADFNTKEGSEAEFLHAAAYSGKKRILVLLLENGASVNDKDFRGSTALHWAAGRGQEAIVKLLLEYHADIDATNKLGFTPLLVAASGRSAAVVKLLLEDGASVNTKGCRGSTALHVAADFFFIVSFLHAS